MAALLLPVQTRAQAPEYQVTVLGSLGGTDGSQADGMNASGQIVGLSYLPGNSSFDVVEWSGTTPTVLQFLGGPSNGARANGINDEGQIVGAGGTTVEEAAEWTGTTATELGPVPGSDYALADAINDSGLAVGYSGTSSYSGGTQYAVEWSGTTPTILESPAGSSFSLADAVNSSGQVVGYTSLGGLAAQAAVEWTGTIPTLLGSLNPEGELEQYDTAQGINASGEIVGQSYDQAVEWSGTTPTALGSFGGTSDAYSINDSGEIVGSYEISGTGTAFLYVSGSDYNLSNLLAPGTGITNLSPVAIDDSGQIAATGEINDQEYALRLTPVPEPDDIAFILAGCAMGAAFARGFARRQIKKADVDPWRSS